jgi:hypothetical protein
VVAHQLCVLLLPAAPAPAAAAAAMPLHASKRAQTQCVPLPFTLPVNHLRTFAFCSLHYLTRFSIHIVHNHVASVNMLPWLHLKVKDRLARNTENYQGKPEIQATT